MTELDTRRYLLKTLALDAAYDAQQIIELRNRQFFAELSASVEPRDTLDRDTVLRVRNENEGKLNAIRRTFWDMSADDLLQALHGVDTRTTPDLKGVVDQLWHVHALRLRFDKLASQANVSKEMITAFRLVVIGDRVQRKEVRDACIRGLAGAKDFDSIHRTLWEIRRHFPDLYGLEPEWLASLLSIKQPARGIYSFLDLLTAGYKISR